jgi:hypothetical protein
MYIAAHLQINTDPIREKNMFFFYLIGIPSNTSCAPSILTLSPASKVVVVGVAGAVDAAVGVPDAVVAVPFGLGGAGLPFRAARSQPWLASTSPPVPSPGQPTTTGHGMAVRTGGQPCRCRGRAGRAAPPDEACAVASAVVPCRASMWPLWRSLRRHTVAHSGAAAAWIGQGLRSCDGGGKDEGLVWIPNSPLNSTIKKKISHHIKISVNAWSTKCRWNQKLIAQFCCTLRDEYFESN